LEELDCVLLDSKSHNYPEEKGYSEGQRKRKRSNVEAAEAGRAER
jgi:hypothetical protein